MKDSAQSAGKLWAPKINRLQVHGKHLLRAISLVWVASKPWTVAWILLLAFQGFIPAVTVSLVRELVDSFVAVIGGSGQWERLQPTVIIAGLIAAVLLLSESLKIGVEWVHAAQAQIVQDHLYGLIHAKSATVDLSFYETPEHFDRLRRAHKDTAHLPVLALQQCGVLFQNTITLLSMGILLLPYGLWLPLVLFLSTLPALWTVFRFNRQYHQWWERTTADWRRIDYYDAILTQSDYAAEMRLFDLGSHFRSAHQMLRRVLRTQGLNLTRKRLVAQFMAATAGLIIFGGAMSWIAWRVLQGRATLGDVALFYQAFERGQTLMRAVLDNLGRIYSHSLFLGNLFEFLALKPQITDPPSPKPLPAPIEEGVRGAARAHRSPAAGRMHAEASCCPLAFADTLPKRRSAV